MFVKRYWWTGYAVTLLIIFLKTSWSTMERAKDNGDIYIVSEEKFLRDHADLMQQEYDTTTVETEITVNNKDVNSNLFDFEEVVALCNSSFSIPMDYYLTFNKTAELPNLVDKTGMCFVRCFYEKSGIIENWKLNVDRIRSNIWPATGDSIEVCEKEGGHNLNNCLYLTYGNLTTAGETNACVRAYAIAKCLTIRALVDARNPE